MKTLIVDNYDSFTFNLYQMIGAIDGEPPLVIANDRLTWQEIAALDPGAIVLSPGPGRPEEDRDFGICRQIILEAKIPVLGVCLGFQGIAQAFGGVIERAREPVHGRTSRIFHSGDGLFTGISQGFSAVRYHSLVVRKTLAPELRITAWTSDEVPMALEHLERPLWGVQFHPESIATEHGSKIFENFRQLANQRRSHIRIDDRHPPVGSAVASAASKPADAAVSAHGNERGGWSTFWRKIHAYPSTEATFCSLFGDVSPAFWLDSAETTAGRFSFMGGVSGPQGMWLSYFSDGQRLELHSPESPGGVEVRHISLFDYLQSELAERRSQCAELPFDFNGGFAGYFGYELKAECGGARAHRSPQPDACLIFADRLIAFDHKENSVYLVYAGQRDEAAAARQWFDETEQRFEAIPPQHVPNTPVAVDLKFHAEQTHERYLESIARCMDYIRAGESYEICLTNRLTVAAPVCPLAYYRGLRRTNPAPHSAFLRFPGVEVACSSPERFLKIDAQRNVESRPIKGTLRRTANAVEDRLLRETLRTSAKTRSENLMIVDLLRNDLGRVCEIGSVHVPQMMEVETYTNLHQLVSTVRGRLRPEATAVDCLRSAFPGGSMTGAPKIRTMELIDRLEPSARGIYSGAIGFLGLNGAADLNIVIRTAVFSGGSASIGVGGAVVALSDPEAEFDESMLKGRALVDAFRPLITGGISSD